MAELLLTILSEALAAALVALIAAAARRAVAVRPRAARGATAV